MTEATRTRLPEKGTDWKALEARMQAMGEQDVDWRSGRAAVYVFHAGEEVLDVAKQAYALYQSENGLGPAAFPSLARMEREVIDMGLGLLQAPDGACGNLTSGGTESILMAVKTCRDQAAARGVDPARLVGGALAMNAGCYGAETWDIVEQVLTIDRRGVQRRRAAAAFETGYRHCALKEGAVLGASEWFAAAWFRLAAGDGAAARARIKDLLARRVATQPLALPNAGSVFRNPPNDHAARLIEACGLKGLSRGGARVSEKHANFIVNPNGAGRAADIEWLIDTVRATVRERTGVELVTEVRIVGEAAA